MFDVLSVHGARLRPPDALRAREALRHLDDAIPTLGELGHPQLRAWDAAGRAEAAALVGQFGAAEVLGRQAMALAIGVGEPVSAATALRPLAIALCQLGRVEECVMAMNGGQRRFRRARPASPRTSRSGR